MEVCFYGKCWAATLSFGARRTPSLSPMLPPFPSRSTLICPHALAARVISPLCPTPFTFPPRLPALSSRSITPLLRP